MPLEFTQFFIDKDVHIRVDRDLDISIPDHDLAYDETLVALGGRKTPELIAIGMIENRPLIHLIPKSGLSHPRFIQYILDALDHIVDHFNGSITPLHKYQQRVKEHISNIRECLSEGMVSDTTDKRMRNLEIGLRNIISDGPSEITEGGHALTGHIRNAFSYIGYESERANTEKLYQRNVALALDEVAYHTFAINESIPSWHITVAPDWHEREHHPFGDYVTGPSIQETLYLQELVWLCNLLLDYVEGKK